MFVYLFGVIRAFLHCTGHITWQVVLWAGETSTYSSILILLLLCLIYPYRMILRSHKTKIESSRPNFSIQRQFVQVLFCKVPPISKQPPTSPHKVRGLNHRLLKWEASVLPLSYHGPSKPDHNVCLKIHH